MQNQVAERFSHAAQRYDQSAIIQKQAAARFDNWLASLGLQPPDAIAEIGCGTGLFTRLMHRRHAGTPLQISDLAPGMVDFCRAGFEPSHLLHFQVCDGRNAVFTLNQDWIVSTMCFQWFDPLAPVLAHHFGNSRVLAFSILLDGSFSAWRAAHERLGLSTGLQPLPAYESVLDICAGLGAYRIHTHRISLNEMHTDGLSFAHSLRAIGADQPHSGHRPVNLRPVCKQLGSGMVSNYEIGFFCVEKRLIY